MITKNKNINQGIANGIECHLAKIFIKDSSKIHFVKREGIVIPTTFASNVEGLLLQHDDSYLQDLKIINNLPGHFLLTPQNSSGDLLDYELERIITFNLKMLTNCNFFLDFNYKRLQ